MAKINKRTVQRQQMKKLDPRTVQRQKMKKLDPIDNIPEYPKQHRSPAPKRRSDFSSFFSSSASSISNSGSFRHGFLSGSMTSLDDNELNEEELHELPLVRFRKSADKKSKPLSDFYEMPVIGVESVARNSTIDQCSDSRQTSSTTMESTHDKSQVAESRSMCTIPGNVVWAKIDRHVWSPAEIIGEKSSVADSRSQGLDGHVLVQFYGKGSAWVDPARDLSQLDEYFEERSCNTTDEFQDALEQALKRKEDLRLHGQFLESLDGSSLPYKQDQSSDKRTSSISSRTECDFLKRGKGKRKQKPKICINEVVFPLKSARNVRRFRIMRYLGLIAPIGSPF